MPLFIFFWSQNKSTISSFQSAKSVGKNSIRLSDLKKITGGSGDEAKSDDDKKLKKQFAASDKAFIIHFTKTLDREDQRTDKES